MTQFQAFMAEAKELLAIPEPGPYPVLLIDDLEKVRGLGAEQAIVQKGMEEIFWSFHWALRIEGCATIWTAPPYIQLSQSQHRAKTYDELRRAADDSRLARTPCGRRTPIGAPPRRGRRPGCAATSTASS